MKVKLTVFFLFINIYTALGQNILTYKGSYEDGVATYKYFEINDERIYEGYFKYSEEFALGYGIRIIEGNFSKNKKNGIWKYSESCKDQTMFNKKYLGFKSILTGKYVNGKREGIWTYKVIQNQTNLILIESNVNFYNDNLCGKFFFYRKKIKSHEIENINSTLSCNFDSSGYLDGAYNLKYEKDKIKYIEIKKFKKGVLEKSSIKNLSTGDITYSYDESSKTSEFFSKVDTSGVIAYINNKKHSLVINKYPEGFPCDEFGLWLVSGTCEPISSNSLLGKIKRGSPEREYIITKSIESY